MTPTRSAFFIAAGATSTPDQQSIDHFGDAQAELRAAVNDTVLAPLDHLGLLEIAGDDAKTFLHNQLTSDINHLGPQRAQHSAWCTAKGRMLASFLIWRREDAYQVAAASELMPELVKRFRMYILRAKAQVSELSASVALVGLSGPRAGEALGAAGLSVPDEPLTTIAAPRATVIRLDPDRFIAAVPDDALPEVWQSLAAHARPVGLAVWRWLDIRAGLPLITAATREEFVPQMADFEKLGGVSFHKGCYPGQEVVARTQYLGKVKRHLYRVSSDTPLHSGDDLHCPENPDQPSGKVVCGAPSPAGGFEALAVVQANFSDRLRLGGPDGPGVNALAVNP